MNALAVMPCTCSPFSVVITVTPVANIPSVLRSATAGSSPSMSTASASANSSNGLAPIPSGPVQLSGNSNSGGRGLAHERGRVLSGS